MNLIPHHGVLRIIGSVLDQDLGETFIRERDGETIAVWRSVELDARSLSRERFQEYGVANEWDTPEALGILFDEVMIEQEVGYSHLDYTIEEYEKANERIQAADLLGQPAFHLAVYIRGIWNEFKTRKGNPQLIHDILIALKDGPKSTAQIREHIRAHRPKDARQRAGLQLSDPLRALWICDLVDFNKKVFPTEHWLTPDGQAFPITQ